jgi:hypothetical protein
VRFGAGFFFVEVLCFVAAVGAGFLAIAAFTLAVLAGLLAVFAETFAGAVGEAIASVFVPGSVARLELRTSLIALVCSCSVIRNS